MAGSFLRQVTQAFHQQFFLQRLSVPRQVQSNKCIFVRFTRNNCAHQTGVFNSGPNLYGAWENYQLHNVSDSTPLEMLTGWQDSGPPPWENLSRNDFAAWPTFLLMPHPMIAIIVSERPCGKRIGKAFFPLVSIITKFPCCRHWKIAFHPENFPTWKPEWRVPMLLSNPRNYDRTDSEGKKLTNGQTFLSSQCFDCPPWLDCTPVHLTPETFEICVIFSGQKKPTPNKPWSVGGAICTPRTNWEGVPSDKNPESG